jgi:hypothetical protein
MKRSAMSILLKADVMPLLDLFFLSDSLISKGKIGNYPLHINWLPLPDPGFSAAGNLSRDVLRYSKRTNL